MAIRCARHSSASAAGLVKVALLSWWGRPAIHRRPLSAARNEDTRRRAGPSSLLLTTRTLTSPPARLAMFRSDAAAATINATRRSTAMPVSAPPPPPANATVHNETWRSLDGIRVSDARHRRNGAGLQG